MNTCQEFAWHRCCAGCMSAITACEAHNAMSAAYLRVYTLLLSWAILAFRLRVAQRCPILRIMSVQIRPIPAKRVVRVIRYTQGL